jgi:putative protein-disulfide isomerase
MATSSRDGSAEAAFREDLKTTRRYRVSGFPTFLIRYDGKEMLIRSYQRYEAFRSLITTMSGGKVLDAIPEKTDENILKFVGKYGRVAPVEIRMAFDLSESETNSIIERLATKGQIKVTPAGNGTFIETSANPMDCDLATGICSL